LQNLSPLGWGQVGDRAASGFGGGEDDLNLPAMSSQIVSSKGNENIDVNGKLGYRTLAVHPAKNSVWVARWTSGNTGLTNINGTVRNFVDAGDSVEFSIYVNGLLAKKIAANDSAVLEQLHFDFDVEIKKGQTVDFVVSGNKTIQGDETWLKATVLQEITASHNAYN
jgi:hypothetical protein